MEIQARWYPDWKAVVRTDCKEPQTTLCFPSLEDCPYRFPEFSPTGWSAGPKSVLIYITTGLLESFTVNSVEGTVHGMWWKNRVTNDGDWVGMATKEIRFPFVIPSFSNAIIQTGPWEIMPGTVRVNNIEVNVSNGSVDLYQWPRKITPVRLTGLPVIQKVAVRIRVLQPRIIG